MTNKDIAKYLSTETHEKFNFIQDVKKRLMLGDPDGLPVEKIYVSKLNGEKGLLTYIPSPSSPGEIELYIPENVKVYIEETKSVKKEEVDLVEVCDNVHYEIIKYIASEAADLLASDDEVVVRLIPQQEFCSGSGCGCFGAVNYKGGDGWKFYCGGSDRCIP